MFFETRVYGYGTLNTAIGESLKLDVLSKMLLKMFYFKEKSLEV